MGPYVRIQPDGLAGGGGIGKTMAEWITTGQAEWDVYAYRPWRFGRQYRDPYYAAEYACERYKHYYRTYYPHDEDSVMRPQRISAFHYRLRSAGYGYTVRKNIGYAYLP